MATTREWVIQSTAVTLMSTELNGLSANTGNISSAQVINSQPTTNTNGYTRCLAQLNLALTTGNYAANSSVDVWWIKQVSASEDGSNTVTPARAPDFSFPLRPVSGAQNIVLDIAFPPGPMYVLAFNNQGSGNSQALAATGNTLKILAYTDQGV